MMRLAKRALIALALMLPAEAAFGQSQTVRQSGSVAQRHVAAWTASGVIQDGGTAALPFLSSLGTLGQGPTICANSAANTAPYNQLCLSANTNSNAQIVLQNNGGAPAVGLDFVVNGVVTTFTGASGGVPGNMVCFLTSGTITTCGLAASAGNITTGNWQASAIAVLFGGTGATTASGARTNLGLGSIATQDATAVAITGGSITGMPTPTLASDVAIKSYVDSTASGLNILAASTLATAAVLPNTPTYNNGTLGVGATLTSATNTTLTVDGTSAPLNTVVLVKNQSAPAQNGIYSVTQAGSGSVPWILTRVTYFDQAAEMKAGSYTFITGGTTNLDVAFTLQSVVTTVGTDPLNFVQFSVGSTGTVTSATIAAGGGIGVSGTCTITVSGTCTVSNTGVTGIDSVGGAFTTGNGVTSSGSVIGLTAARRTLPTTQRLISGSGTYTTPANVLWIELHITGGGGGGGAGAAAGSASGGGNTCWNTTGSACTTPVYQSSGGSAGGATSGGNGGGVSGSSTCNDSDTGAAGASAITSDGANISGIGGVGGNGIYGGAGTNNYNGGGGAAAANTGAGGGGGGTGIVAAQSGGGGGAGGHCYAIINSPAGSYTYTIGAGGAGGTAAAGGFNGGAGATGKIVVIEHYGS